MRPYLKQACHFGFEEVDTLILVRSRLVSFICFDD